MCFSYHSTLGRTVVLGTPLELVAEQSHPSYHRAPEETNLSNVASGVNQLWKCTSKQTNFGTILSFLTKECDLYCH